MPAKRKSSTVTSVAGSNRKKKARSDAREVVAVTRDVGTEMDKDAVILASGEERDLIVPKGQGNGVNEFYSDPPKLASVNSQIGFHVPSAVRQKIIDGQYVELGTLLDIHSPPVNESRRLEVGPMGELMVKPPQSVKVINSIENWTDAFIVYSSIFLSGHPERSQELLKYMSNIRTAASRHSGLGWKHYDQQFRLRLADDPAGISFANIDSELWLMYVGSQSRPSEQVTMTLKKCFDFNYKVCGRVQCPYRHACMNCNAYHPYRWCHANKGPSPTFKGPTQSRFAVARGRGWVGPSARPDIRPRFGFSAQKF